ncbi:MAG: hypothetical protein AAGB26_05760 [Planctomycetota bacterium]
MNLFFKAIALIFIIFMSEGHPASLKAEEAQPQRRDIEVMCDAPTPNFAIKIKSVWLVGEELWVVSQIRERGKPDRRRIQGEDVSKWIKDVATITGHLDKRAKFFIIGKTWDGWKGTGSTFITNQLKLLDQMGEDRVEIDEVLFGDDPREQPAPEGMQKIKVRCTAPQMSYSVHIARVWLVGEEVWVLVEYGSGKPGEPHGKYPIKDSVLIPEQKGKKVRCFVSGLVMPDWEGPEYTKVAGGDALRFQMEQDGIKIDKVLYTRELPEEEK